MLFEILSSCRASQMVFLLLMISGPISVAQEKGSDFKPSEEHESLVRDWSVYPAPYYELGWDDDATDILNPERLGYHSEYLLNKYGDRIAIQYRGHEEAFTILYSTLGYDPDRVKHAIVRQTKLGRDKEIMIKEEGSSWRLLTYRGDVAAEGKFEYYGEFLGMDYWIIDFSDIEDEAEGYRIEAEVKTESGFFDVSFKSEPFDIQQGLLVQRTAHGVGVSNFDERKIVHHVNPLGDPYLGKGFMDCNGNMSEIRHHVWCVYGFADLLKEHSYALGPMSSTALEKHLKWACDHIHDLQLEDGMYMDQPPDRFFGEWGHWTLDLNFYGGVAMCIGYEMFREKDSKRADEYLEAAEKGYIWVSDKGRDPRRQTFGVLTAHGPTHITDKEKKTWTVTDHSEMLWFETELYKATGDEKYIKNAKQRMKLIRSLQVTDPGEAIHGVYGDFYLQPGVKIRTFEIYERAHICLHGVLNLIRLLPDDPDAPKWKNSLELYGEKYMKQVTSLNPFGITPAGTQDGEFVWLRPYGRNPGLLQMAVQNLELAELFQDEDYYDIATNHVQWILGLHIGIPGTEAQPWSYLEAVPASFINGIGSRFALQVEPPGGDLGAHVGPGGYRMEQNWRDGKRYFWAHPKPHGSPTLVMGLTSGAIGNEIIEDYYSHKNWHCAETVICVDGLWMSTMARYDKFFKPEAK
ncbi:glycoside hydrolase family 9 protein [Bacteroidota bacterium]